MEMLQQLQLRSSAFVATAATTTKLTRTTGLETIGRDAASTNKNLQQNLRIQKR